MPGTVATATLNAPPFPRKTVGLLLLGLFLSLRGYQAFDGDQAYRLPILLHTQNPSVYLVDPFVRSFDAFNPHRGSLALIAVVSRPFGLAAALVGLFGLTYLLTSAGIDRLTRAVWPEAGPAIGMVSLGLVLATLAGNVGTNHLFEPLLLDRQMDFALGWVAMALVVASPARAWSGAALCIGLAALVHPTLGLQIGSLLIAGWLGWVIAGRWTDVTAGTALLAVAALAVALLPGLAWNLRNSSHLLDGLSRDEFRLLSVELQGPQHMLPHLWRLPQWLAWGCFPLLAGASWWSSRAEQDEVAVTPARSRLLVLIVANLAALAVAWVGVEVVGNLRLTLFQPFRLTTVTRGLCLVILADHVLRLWRRGGGFDRGRAVVLVVGLAGDWMLVAATAFEWTNVVGNRLVNADRGARRIVVLTRIAGLVVLGGGLLFLSMHDTESGHLPLCLAFVVPLAVFSRVRPRPIAWTRGRRLRLLVAAWALPLSALVVGMVPEDWFPAGAVSVRQDLVRRWRFAEQPVDDLERLALWSRGHTEPDARFVVPPGPKGFRLWSRRSVAFNRAGSPYNALGLADWARRYRDHVSFEGTTTELVQAYQRDRHALERRYDRMSDADLAALADREGANYVVAARHAPEAGSGIEAVHAEGKWSVYRRVGGPVIAGRSLGEVIR